MQRHKHNWYVAILGWMGGSVSGEGRVLQGHVVEASEGAGQSQIYGMG